MFSLYLWGALKTAQAAILPIAASEAAQSFDTMWAFVLWLSVFFFVLVIGAMIYFAIVYRNKPGSRAHYITGNIPLEVTWTLFPLFLLLVIFVWGYSVYSEVSHAPSNAMEVRVVAKQWLWQFQYPDTGKITINDLYVPVNKPVKLIMSSEDVIHSFFIPNMRTKQDVVPGMYTTVWFEATVPGRHQIFCTEYCGTSHSEMLANLNVLSAEQWEAWKKGKKPPKLRDARDILAGTPATADELAATGSDSEPTVSLADQGRDLTHTKGCFACHSDDGSRKVGPSYKGLYGSEVELADGSKVTADDNYIRESIENPTAKVVKGFAPTMPPFKGLVSETELNALIAYIKSLK